VQQRLGADHYVSGTFWLTVVVVLLTLALVGLGMWAVRRQAPKRQMTYRFGPTVPMLASPYSSRLRVQWTSQAGETEQLTHPYVAGVTLTNSGRADTGTAAFDGNRPITVSFGSSARVLSPLEVSAPNKISVEIIGNTLTIGPGLIKKGEQVSVRLLTEGDPSYSIDAPLIDFDVTSAEHGSSLFGGKRRNFIVVVWRSAVPAVAVAVAAVLVGVIPSRLIWVKNQVAVPALRNAQASTAAVELAAKGLKLGQVLYQPSTTVPKGEVIGSVPAANRKVDPGSTIIVVVSSGPS